MKIVVVLNYVLRVMTIVLGILIIVKPWESGNSQPYFIQAFGVVTIAFGVFRLYTYHRRLQQLKQQEEQERQEDTAVDEEESTEKTS